MSTRPKVRKRQRKNILYNKAKRMGYILQKPLTYAKLTSTELQAFIDDNVGKVKRCVVRKPKELTPYEKLVAFVRTPLDTHVSKDSVPLTDEFYHEGELMELLKNLPYDREDYLYYLDIEMDDHTKRLTLSNNWLNSPDNKILDSKAEIGHGSDIEAMVKNLAVSDIRIEKVRKQKQVAYEEFSTVKPVRPTTTLGYLPYKLSDKVESLAKLELKEYQELERTWSRHVPTTDCVYNVIHLSELEGKIPIGSTDKYAAWRLTGGDVKDMKLQLCDDVAQLLKVQFKIHLHYEDSKPKIHTYPKLVSEEYKNYPTIEMVSFRNHVFLFETTKFTKFSLMTAMNPDNFKKFYQMARMNKTKNKFAKFSVSSIINENMEVPNKHNAVKYANSLDFVRLMLDNTELTQPLTQEEINEQLSSYQEINEKHINCDSVALDSGFIKPGKFQPKTLKPPFSKGTYDDIIFADFETINIPQVGKYGKLVPFFLCTIYMGVTRKYGLRRNSITGDLISPAEQFLRDMSNGVYGSNNMHKVIFHNLKFDIHMFYGITGFRRDGKSTISTGFGMKCTKAYYYKQQIYFKDSLSVIPMKLSDMPSAFQLNKEGVIESKGSCPYNYYTYETLQEDSALIKDAAKYVSRDTLYEFYESLSNYIVPEHAKKYQSIKANLLNSLKSIYPKNRSSPITQTQLACLVEKRDDQTLNFDVSESDESSYKALEVYDKYVLDLQELRYDHHGHVEDYCVQDVKILEKSWKAMRDMTMEILDLDINNALSVPQLAHTYGYNKECFSEVSEVKGYTREFLQKFVVGGRVELQNKQKYKASNIADLDCNSLYPSAIVSLCRKGLIPKGNGRRILDNEKNLAALQGHIFFVDIRLPKGATLGGIKKRSIPSFHVRGKGFTNEIEPSDVIHVTNIDLSELMIHHGLEESHFEILGGIVFDTMSTLCAHRLQSLIEGLYAQRMRLKSEGKSAQLIIKLVLNAFYGKLIQKPIRTQEEIFYDYQVGEYNHAKYNEFLERNYDRIVDIRETDKASYLSLTKNGAQQSNYAHLGALVLSESKSIMNRVMYLAEDKDIPIYYTDTDSLHLPDDKVKILERAYYEKYGEVMLGKGLGQFSSDFDTRPGYGSGVAAVSIGIAKKTYIDQVESLRVPEGVKGHINDKDISSPLEKDTKLHIRAKGISKRAMLSKCKEDNHTPIDEYHKLYNGEKREYDLLADNGCSFEFRGEQGIFSRKKFMRCINL